MNFYNREIERRNIIKIISREESFLKKETNKQKHLKKNGTI